ncbi:hypothetical protein Droror1_Dr00025742 [Drosera rotundifolia]
MTTNTVSKEVYDHGMALDPESKRVQCNYCGKVVEGFEQLQFHLGGVRGHGKGCRDVPVDVKGLFRNGEGEVKVGNPGKVVWEMNGSESSLRSGSPSNLKEDSSKRIRTENPQNGLQHYGKAAVANYVFRGGVAEISSNGFVRSVLGDSGPSREGQSSSVSLVKKSIGRFFFENGIDFSSVESSSFRKMIEVAFASREVWQHIPSIRELKGLILDHELYEMNKYVNDIKKSWPSTGCSILLDGWKNGEGRELMNIIVDCPHGPVYLRSVDVSAIATDIEGLEALLGGVIEEAGVHNVIQVVSHVASECMDNVGKRLMERYRSLFWSVSATHCVVLMLEKVGTLNSVSRVMAKAKTITRFIYSRAAVLALMRNYISSDDLLKPSMIKAAIPYLTLEAMLMEKRSLEAMLASRLWSNSQWASEAEGKEVATLVGDKSFWNELTSVVKATIPLVRVLSLVNKDGMPYTGFIYETMDQVKETISQELGMKKWQYMPYWSIIDDVWNNVLHSPLHAAGYFLNPSFYYTEDFYSDSEVAGGLLITIVRLVEDQLSQDLVSQQIDFYRDRKGPFKRQTESRKRNTVHPAEWWSEFGGHCPNLQKLAVRILSQTCNGAESYALKRNLAEKLLTSGRNLVEQQRLTDLVFVHYNLQLRHFKEAAKFEIASGEIDPTDDWIVDVTYQQYILQKNPEGVGLSSTQSSLTGDGPSTARPKVESA